MINYNVERILLGISLCILTALLAIYLSYVTFKNTDFDTLLDAREKSLKLHKSAQYLIEKK